jgi:tetratricopeptide (TPR) repeat protein
VSWKWYEAEQATDEARQAERRALALAESEAQARRQAERAQRGTALALKYLTASTVADTFRQLPGDSSTLLARVGKRPEVIRSLQQICAVGEQLLDDNPHGRLVLTLGEQYAELAVFQAAGGQRTEAVRSCRRGLELLRRLPWPERQAHGSDRELGVTFFLLGAALMNLDQPGEAAGAFQQAVRHQRAALDEVPADRPRRKALSVYFFHLGHVLRQDGRLAESAATALERLKLWPDEPDEVYDVACELARCGAAVAAGKADAVLTASQRAERRHFCDEAVRVLGQAVALGLKGAASVRRDPDLAILRPRDDFQELVRGLASKEARPK